MKKLRLPACSVIYNNYQGNTQSLIEEFIKLGEYFKKPKAISLELKIINFIKTYRTLPPEVAKR